MSEHSACQATIMSKRVSGRGPANEGSCDIKQRGRPTPRKEIRSQFQFGRVAPNNLIITKMVAISMTMPGTLL